MNTVSVLEAVWVGFTVHYHGGGVIWFCWAESCCMWILQAGSDLVPECFSSGHRMGESWLCLYYWDTSAPRAQSRHLECISLDILSVLLWRGVGNVYFYGTFCYSRPPLSVSCSLCMGDEPQLIHKYEGTPRGLRSWHQTVGSGWWGLSIAV